MRALLITAIVLAGFSDPVYAAPDCSKPNPPAVCLGGGDGVSQSAGEKGETGDKGEKGDTGAPGLNGSDANADLGIALGIAMSGSVWLEPKENFAVAGSWGHYEGESAFALSGVARIQGSLSATGAIGISDDGRKVGSRLGVRYGW
jgi:hypothetical protein